MNRHERRAQKANQHLPQADYAKGASWKQWPDPTDPKFLLVEMRLPVTPGRMRALALKDDDAVTIAGAFAMATCTETIVRVRALVVRLCEAKSTHAWTTEECDLLAGLCASLGIVYEAPQEDA